MVISIDNKYYIILVSLLIAFICVFQLACNLEIEIHSIRFCSTSLVVPIIFAIQFIIYRLYGRTATNRAVYSSSIALIVYTFIVSSLASLPSPDYWNKGQHFSYVYDHFFIKSIINILLLQLSHHIIINLLKKVRRTFFSQLIILYTTILLGTIIVAGFTESYKYYFYPEMQPFSIKGIVIGIFVWSIILSFLVITCFKILKIDLSLGKKSDAWHKNNKISRSYIFLSSICIIIILASHSLAYKVIVFSWITLAGSGIMFPLTFIFSDVVAEVYGFKLNRAMIWGILIGQFIFNITIYLIINVSSSSGFIIEAYKGVFGNIPRQIMAATLSVSTAFFINGILISKFKIYMYGKQFWLRTILSSIVGKTTLCLINYGFLFIGIFSLAQFWNIVWTTWIVKFIFSLFMAPLAVIFANQLKRSENRDHYDYKENYYPFSIKLN